MARPTFIMLKNFLKMLPGISQSLYLIYTLDASHYTCVMLHKMYCLNVLLEYLIDYIHAFQHTLTVLLELLNHPTPYNAFSV